eukprot:m.159660 g.159660  ORF g.159660 m.159660 type:complete len:144 (+) comp23755_c0_seq1:1190-1621(+)
MTVIHRIWTIVIMPNVCTHPPTYTCTYTQSHTLARSPRARAQTHTQHIPPTHTHTHGAFTRTTNAPVRQTSLNQIFYSISLSKELVFLSECAHFFHQLLVDGQSLDFFSQLVLLDVKLSDHVNVHILDVSMQFELHARHSLLD